ncbi:hypothetical protein FB451DRAFT_1401095 [Mycena latifolia]|nr:hypothetical protein FB451DRAFT_1401095 [Mycena latifolia]
MSTDPQALAHRRAIEDVLEFLGLQSTILPDFPVSPSYLRLACGQVSVSPNDEQEMKGTPLFEGGALLRAMLGDHFPVLFSDQTPGISTVHVLISDRANFAVASYFGWQCPSPGISKEQLLWLMVHYCDLSAKEELGAVALSRWARELYRPLAIIARSALYPTWADEVIQTKNYIANLGNTERRHTTDVQMEAYLARGKISQHLDDKWLDRFPIAKKIIDGPDPSAEANGTRKIHRLPIKRRCHG